MLNEARFSYNEVKECCSPDFGVKWKDEFRYGLRASECKPNEPSARKYLLLGSICFSILGCDEYTPMYDTPYRCAKCMDGYYLNERQECTPCDNQRYPGNTKN